jgi:hypothetical protein
LHAEKERKRIEEKEARAKALSKITPDQRATAQALMQTQSTTLSELVERRGGAPYKGYFQDLFALMDVEADKAIDFVLTYNDNEQDINTNTTRISFSKDNKQPHASSRPKSTSGSKHGFPEGAAITTTTAITAQSWGLIDDPDYDREPITSSVRKPRAFQGFKNPYPDPNWHRDRSGAGASSDGWHDGKNKDKDSGFPFRGGLAPRYDFQDGKPESHYEISSGSQNGQSHKHAHSRVSDMVELRVLKRRTSIAEELMQRWYHRRASRQRRLVFEVWRTYVFRLYAGKCCGCGCGCRCAVCRMPYHCLLFFFLFPRPFSLNTALNQEQPMLTLHLALCPWVVVSVVSGIGASHLPIKDIMRRYNIQYTTIIC